MAPTRSLPLDRNPHLVDNVPPYAELVNRRCLGQTKLNARMVSGSGNADSPFYGVFDYAHLRAPLPRGIVSGIFHKGSPNSYFLMRRSADGYVSATGMFKATFPYANTDEEEAERKFIKSLPSTSPEETAGNVWISPDQAVVLADEYGITPWVRALLDPADIAVSGSSNNGSSQQITNGTASPPPKVIAAPPKYFHGVAAPPTPNSLPPRSRARRSASPSKLPVGKRGNHASPRKRTAAKTSLSSLPSLASSEASSTKASPSLSNSELSSVPAVPVPIPILAPVAENSTAEAGAAIREKEEEEEQKVKITVDQDVKVDTQGTETTHTSVEVELPVAGEPPSAEEAARMVAEAKEMVKAATEAVTASPAPVSTERTPTKKGKRKAADISVDEEEEHKPKEENAESQATGEAPQAKKLKTQAEEKRDRVRKRAIFGIGATIAVGAASALVPYVMNML